MCTFKKSSMVWGIKVELQVHILATIQISEQPVVYITTEMHKRTFDCVQICDGWIISHLLSQTVTLTSIVSQSSSHFPHVISYISHTAYNYLLYQTRAGYFYRWCLAFWNITQPSRKTIEMPSPPEPLRQNHGSTHRTPEALVLEASDWNTNSK